MIFSFLPSPSIIFFPAPFYSPCNSPPPPSSTPQRQSYFVLYIPLWIKIISITSKNWRALRRSDAEPQQELNRKFKMPTIEVNCKRGLHRILIWPDIRPSDIRQIFLPDIRLNSNIEFFFLLRKKMYLQLVFCLRICYTVIYWYNLSVKTIFDFKQFF